MQAFAGRLGRVLKPNGVNRVQARTFAQRFNGALVIDPEVRDAVMSGQPVVALESTIISHGLPYPRNLEVATQLENIVREHGGIPATTAIINGVPRVGLSALEIQALAENKGARKVVKASHRDLGYICAKKLDAATTVASTMVLANLAGIRVFATGGIGGVHRGAEATMDISADLTELSNTPVTVVSSGVKSILDIPKTLEVLETLGVPVCGFKTKEFPGFFTNVTGCPSPLVIDSAMDAALMMHHSMRLGLKNGMLVAVPNPTPTSEGGINDADMARIIEDAVLGAAAKGVAGAAITPYLLSKVAELTGGSSIDSNVALVCNNAKVATMIAADYSKLILSNARSAQSVNSYTIFPSVRAKSKPVKFRVAVVGGMVIDHVVRPECSRGSTTPPPLIMRTSNPGVASQSFGGVGRNVAEAVSMALGEERSDVAVHMVSTVGNDAYGSSLLQHSAGLGIDVSCVIRGSEESASTQRTATYTAVHDHSGDLLVAVADMDIFKGMSKDVVKVSLGSIFGANGDRKIVVSDGNISQETFQCVASFCADSGAVLFYEPTSVPKCTIPVKAGCLQQVNVIKPNVDELRELVKTCRNDKQYAASGLSDNLSQHVDSILLTPPDAALSMEDVCTLASALSGYMTSATSGRHDILVSMGGDGILWYTKEAGGKTAVEIVPVPKIENPDGRSLVTNGAGDAFSGGFIKGLCDDDSTTSSRELYRHAIICGLSAARRRIFLNSGLSV